VSLIIEMGFTMTTQGKLDKETMEVLEKLAERAAEHAIKKVLLNLGIDTTNTLESQDTFAAMREVKDLIHDDDFRRDLYAIRDWRKGMADIKSKTLWAVISVILLGLATAAWQGIKEALK